MTRKIKNAQIVPAFTIALALFQARTYAQITIADTEPDSTGRKWSVYLQGFLQTDMMLDFQEMGSKDGIVAPSIVIPQRNSRSGYISIKQSQIGLGLKQIESNGDSPASVYAEIDFYGPDGTTNPRLRHAYVKWKKWLIGQTWSNFSDVEIFPNIFDFNGANGAMFLRSVQLRYTEQLSDQQVLSFSLEDPGTVSMTIPDSHPEWKRKNMMPVLTASYCHGTKDYIKIAGVLSSVDYENSDESHTKLGFGGVLSLRKYINSNTNIRLQTSFGKGYARNNIVLSGEGYDAVFDPQRNRAETLSLFNILGIWEHWWAPQWSSVAYYSYSQVGSNPVPGNGLMKRFQNAAINIIYQAGKNLRLDVEGNYARTQNAEGIKGDAFRLQFTTSYSFR